MNITFNYNKSYFKKSVAVSLKYFPDILSLISISFVVSKTISDKKYLRFFYINIITASAGINGFNENLRGVSVRICVSYTV
jgi:hypothetical protein